MWFLHFILTELQFENFINYGIVFLLPPNYFFSFPCPAFFFMAYSYTWFKNILKILWLYRVFLPLGCVLFYQSSKRLFSVFSSFCFFLYRSSFYRKLFLMFSSHVVLWFSQNIGQPKGNWSKEEPYVVWTVSG